MDEREEQVEKPAHQAAVWLGESISPYGLADEDATLRQTDSAKWRTLFGGRRQKRFIAVKRELTPPPSTSPTTYAVRDSNLKKTNTTVVPAKSLASVVSVQTFVATIIVVGILYLTKSNSTSATEIRTFLHHAYQIDYSKMVIPTFQKLIQQIHVSSTGSFTSLINAHQSHVLHTWNA